MPIYRKHGAFGQGDGMNSHTSIGRIDEEFRQECEARSWIRQGYYSADRVDELMARIAKHRGIEAANKLRAEMRRQWARRAEWLDVAA